MLFSRSLRDTLIPCALNHGDTLQLTLTNGRRWDMMLLSSSAEISARAPASFRFYGDIAAYRFSCEVKINGAVQHLHREVGTQASFYEPWVIDGVRIWFDAVQAIFTEQGGFMEEKDWRSGFLCKPHRHARFALQEDGRPICPEPVHRWCELPNNAVAIEDCYNGEDCWMGPYAGALAHCGLDINMPNGSLLYAPITFDDQYYFHSLAAGFENNRWRGIRRWPDGSEWWLQSHHLVELLVPPHTPLSRGTPYATTAGVHIGDHEHSHFIFRILDQGGEYFLDPWILFQQMLREQ